MPGAAVAFELMSVPAQGVGLAEIAEDAAIRGVVDDRKHLLGSLAETVERSAQIISREQKRGVRQYDILYRLAPISALRRRHLSGVDDAAEAAAVIDDEHLLVGARRKPPA